MKFKFKFTSSSSPRTRPGVTGRGDSMIRRITLSVGPPSLRLRAPSGLDSEKLENFKTI